MDLFYTILVLKCCYGSYCNNSGKGGGGVRSHPATFRSVNLKHTTWPFKMNIQNADITNLSYRGHYVKLYLYLQLLLALKKASVIDSWSTVITYRHLTDFSRMLVNTDKHIVIWHIFLSFVIQICIMTTLKIQTFHRTTCIGKDIPLSAIDIVFILYWPWPLRHDLDKSQHALCSW